MCSLYKKCPPVLELLHRTVLARSQAYLPFEVLEVHLLFPLKYLWKTFSADFVALLVFFFFFASLSSRRRFKSSSDNVANLDFDIAIHRMQIWRTTRSSAGTSQMKARLVRLWSFVLTMLFQESLASLSIWSLGFALPTRFCVPECHRNRVESSTAEKVFFPSDSSFASEEKPKRRRQEVHDRRKNC